MCTGIPIQHCRIIMDAVFERESNLGQKVCGEREERKRRGRGEKEKTKRRQREREISLSQKKKAQKFSPPAAGETPDPG